MAAWPLCRSPMGEDVKEPALEVVEEEEEEKLQEAGGGGGAGAGGGRVGNGHDDANVPADGARARAESRRLKTKWLSLMADGCRRLAWFGAVLFQLLLTWLLTSSRRNWCVGCTYYRENWGSTIEVIPHRRRGSVYHYYESLYGGTVVRV